MAFNPGVYHIYTKHTGQEGDMVVDRKIIFPSQYGVNLINASFIAGYFKILGGEQGCHYFDYDITHNRSYFVRQFNDIVQKTLNMYGQDQAIGTFRLNEEDAFMFQMKFLGDISHPLYREVERMVSGFFKECITL